MQPVMLPSLRTRALPPHSREPPPATVVLLHDQVRTHMLTAGLLIAGHVASDASQPAEEGAACAVTGTSPLCGGADALVSSVTDCRGGRCALLAAWTSCASCARTRA